MLDYFHDIKLSSDEECPVYFLRNTAFTKLHKALYDSKQTSIGISFPNYKTKLGDVIRLHGDKVSLQALQQTNWLGGLSGYCEMSDILPVPEKVEGYRTVSRIQQNLTNAKLKRLIKRNSISGDEAKKYKAKMLASGLDNPYMELQSASTGEQYRIYIAFGDFQDKSVEGKFNHFGLSKTATIPWF